MAAAAQAPIRGVVNTRRVPRFRLAVPIHVTALRAGIPYAIPGRSVSIDERGLGVVLAGELYPGDFVGLEFHLPDTGDQLRLKAVVQHQSLLRCGLQFLNMTSEQQTLIERWTRDQSSSNPRALWPLASPQFATPPAVTSTVPLVQLPAWRSRGARLHPALWIALAAMLLAGGLGCWHWYRAWSELESQIPGSKPFFEQPLATVPAEVMEGLVTHKVEPVYPAAARQTNIQGVVVLDAVIGPDGTVVDLRPISGPDQLAPAAVDAAKWWRFQPYRVNGQAVQVKTKLAVEFRGN